MGYTLLISEVLDLVKKAKGKEEKVSLLKKHESLGLKTMLRLNFDKTVQLVLPEGVPENVKLRKDIPNGMGETTLEHSVKKFGVFVKGNYPTLRQYKKESMFMLLLEALCTSEATLLIEAKDRKLKGISRDVVLSAFPTLLKDNVKVKGAAPGES